MRSDEKLRRMIRDLGRTLAEAISDSSEASRTLRRLHAEGYAISLELGRSSRTSGPGETLTLFLERRPREGLGEQGPGEPGPRESGLQESGLQESGLQECSPALDPARALPPALPPRSETSEPAFQIDGRDLAFLRSIGIDPTRRPRKQRR